MPDTIGRVTVPSPVASSAPATGVNGSQFPLSPSEFGFGVSQDLTIVTHRFQSLATLATQRFFVGSGARRFHIVKSRLSYAERTSLVNFYNATQGGFQTFTYAVPNPNLGSIPAFTNTTCVFDAPPLSITDLENACQTGLTLIEFLTSSASYTVSSICTRFPDSILNPALTAQVQTIIPLLTIRVRNPAVPTIYLSDRRVTVTAPVTGPQLYLPRLLNIGEPGSDVLLTQTIDGRADNVRFTFGNADRVFSRVTADCSLKYADISLSLFHVNTGIRLDLWRGIIVNWQLDGGTQFSVSCSDGIYPINQTYPRRTISRQCWKPYTGAASVASDPCPWAQTAGHTGNPTSCDYFYDSPNGCLSHGMSNFFGGQPAQPQSVVIKDNGTGIIGGFLRSAVTSTSIVSDAIWDTPLPEIWCNDGGNPIKAFWANAIIAAVRDESDYEDVLGIIGVGPISAYEGMSVQTNADGYKFLVCPLADGFPPQGFSVDSQLRVTGYHPTLGLRQSLGPDPVHLGSSPTDGIDAFSLGQGSPQHWEVPTSTGFSNDGVAGTFIPYAAGTALCELRYKKSAGSGISPTTAESHQMVVPIARGLSGVKWTTTDNVNYTQSVVSGLTNPFWIAVNLYLRAIGMDHASAAAQLATILPSWITHTTGIGCADIADLQVSPLVGGSIITSYKYTSTGLALDSPNLDQYNNTFTWRDGSGDLQSLSLTDAVSAGYITATSSGSTEPQFQAQGTISQFKPFRDWLTELLNCCLGYFTFQFGRLALGIRDSAVPLSAFSPANMLYQSLAVTPMEAAFEYMKLDFANVDYQYQMDMAEYNDKDHAIYYGRQGVPLPTRVRSAFTPTMSQALRLVATRVREEIGGILRPDHTANPYIEWDNANRISFKSTILALETYAGQPISVTHPDLPTYPGAAPGARAGDNGPFSANTWPFRIERWSLHKDWSVSISARSNVDSMYDLEVGPQPTGVSPLPAPILSFVAPLGQWAPYQIQASASDALFPSEWTFDLAQNYQTLTNGSPLATAIASGRLPVVDFIPNAGAVDVKAGNVARATTGGSITGGTTIYVQICGKDASGRYTVPSDILVLQAPIGTNTNKFTLNDIAWPSGASLTDYVVFIGTSTDLICGQQTGSGSPSSIVITGPVARSTYAVPNANIKKLRLKGKRLIHGGVIGGGVDSRTGTTITCSAIIDGTLADNWAGRALAVIGRSNGTAPFCSFDITAFDPATGVFTLSGSLSPITAGVQVGDAFAVCFLGYDNSGDPYHISDSGLSNISNGHTGETVNDPNRIGNFVLVIKGKSRGQSAKIVSNTATSYKIDRPLYIDTTSVWIVVTAAWEFSSDIDVTNADPLAVTKATMEISNYLNLPLIVTGVTVDVNGIEVTDANLPFRMLFVFGAQGTRNITASGSQLPTDGILLNDTSAGAQSLQLLSSSLVKNQFLLVRKSSSDANALTINTDAGDSFPDGSTSMTLASDQDSVLLRFPGSGNVVIPIAGFGSSSSGASYSTTQVMTGPVTINSPGPAVDRALWVVRLDQDSTGGRAVTWGTDVLLGPIIGGGLNDAPSTMCLITFVAFGGKWYCTASMLGEPIL